MCRLARAKNGHTLTLIFRPDTSLRFCSGTDNVFLLRTALMGDPGPFERSETRLNVGEWDVLPPRADGERVSVFDYVPGRIEPPDRQVMRMEKEQLLGEFKDGFEVTLGKRPGLLNVFRGAWDGQKRREIAQALWAGRGRVKALQGQMLRRLANFCSKTRGGIRETLEGIWEGG